MVKCVILNYVIVPKDMVETSKWVEETYQPTHVFPVKVVLTVIKNESLRFVRNKLKLISSGYFQDQKGKMQEVEVIDIINTWQFDVKFQKLLLKALTSR